MSTEKFLRDLLDLRHETKKAVMQKASSMKLPTRDEQLAMELEMYSKAGSMGSKNTPLYRGKDVR